MPKSKTPPPKNLPLRIALREEGHFWNAYIAQPGTMKNALLIGSIAMGVVRQNPDLKQRFMDLMTDAFTAALPDNVSISEFNITTAPDHERAGKA